MPSLEVRQGQTARKALSHKGRGKSRAGRWVDLHRRGDSPGRSCHPPRRAVGNPPGLWRGQVSYSCTTPLRKAPRTPLREPWRYAHSVASLPGQNLVARLSFRFAIDAYCEDLFRASLTLISLISAVYIVKTHNIVFAQIRP
jgi:hypothetical protein